jgi:hypothetical protein
MAAPGVLAKDGARGAMANADGGDALRSLPVGAGRGVHAAVLDEPAEAASAAVTRSGRFDWPATPGCDRPGVRVR